jgi:hypothetical protein
MKRVFRVIGGFFGAIIIFVILSKLLIFIGPIIAGFVILSFELKFNPRVLENIISIGDIFVFFVSFYAGIKAYKLIVGKKI